MNDTDDLLTMLDGFENENLDLNSIQSNVILLDDEKNDSTVNVVTPDSILNEYTKLEFEKRQAELAIEEFKQENLEIFEKFEKLNSMVDNISIKQSDVKTRLTDSLEKSGRKDCLNQYFKATFVAATKRETFDKDKFKNKYPVLYSQFLKVSDVSAYTKISEVKKK